MHILTFDIGTTALKTALVDAHGRVCALHTEEYTPDAPKPDWAQMPVERYWHAAVTGCQAVRSQCSGEVAAIGFSSQGQSFVLLNASDQPLYPAMIWVDNRAREMMDEWRTWLGGNTTYHRATGYPDVLPGLTLFMLAWLHRYCPETHNAARLLCLPDYLIYRLTGEAVTDQVTAQASGMYDVAIRNWRTDWVRHAGYDAAILPRVVASGAVAGALTRQAADELGLTAGIPVCTGTNDQLSGALGAANVAPGITTETTGTALAVVTTTDTMVIDTRLLSGLHPIDPYGYALPYTPTSAVVLKWLRDLVWPDAPYELLMQEAATVPPGAGGLSVLPHFAGTATPDFILDARGAILGLTLGHTRAHLIRAVMESCAFMLQECLQAVADQGVSLGPVRSLGGAARSDLWLQIKADLLNVPVERPACSDAASLGAAILAAPSTGLFQTAQEAALSWYHPAGCFEPRADQHVIYQSLYARYQQVRKDLYYTTRAGLRADTETTGEVNPE